MTTGARSSPQRNSEKKDPYNQILKLRAEKADLETQRDRELRQSEFSLNEARRQMEATAELLTQNTQVISPIEGRVLEVKISAGSVLAVGTPVVGIESEGDKLEAADLYPRRTGQEDQAGNASAYRTQHGQARRIRHHARHCRNRISISR